MIGIGNSYVFNYVPLGLIVPYYSAAAIPSGWDLFDSADGAYITGADVDDADYSVGTHSGTTATTDITTSTTGDHTGTGITVRLGNLPGQDPGPPVQLEAHKRANTEAGALKGNHYHTTTFTPSLGYEETRFIKSTEILDRFPAGALVLSDRILTPPSGVAQQIVVVDSDNNRFLKANTSIDTAYNSHIVACSSDGDHIHNWVTLANTAFERGEAGSSTQWVVKTGAGATTGAHVHTFTTSAMTENMKKIYLSAWTNASASFQGFSNIIAMWESFTPPPGWVLCDGNNGTKNLTKRFVMFGPNSSVGQYAGDGKLTFSATLDSNDFTHEHMNQDDYLASRITGTVPNVNHINSDTFPHTHTVTTTQADFLPDYYSLVFIQKL